MIRFQHLIVWLSILSIYVTLPSVSVHSQSVSAEIFAPAGVEPGSIIEVKILMSSQRQLGGLDFTIRYSDSLFALLGIEQDTGLNNWEYFVSSNNQDSGLANIFTIADIANGPIHPDSSDFHPKGSIAKFSFFVAPNWTADSSKQTFSFFWRNCTDNAASDKSGFLLLLVDRVLDQDGNLMWDETDSTNFPESNRIANIGVPDSCISSQQGLEFTLEFSFGAAKNYYICGDADANLIITISDAVQLINFIFSGGAEPSPPQAGDADCNSIVTISDAVYIINYIFAGGSAPCDCP